MSELYTFGYVGSYRRTLSWARCHATPMLKAAGGIAFETPEEARQWLIANGGYAGRPAALFAVFAMEAVPTAAGSEPVGLPYRAITRDARIIREVPRA